MGSRRGPACGPWGRAPARRLVSESGNGAERVRVFGSRGDLALKGSWGQPRGRLKQPEDAGRVTGGPPASGVDRAGLLSWEEGVGVPDLGLRLRFRPPPPAAQGVGARVYVGARWVCVSVAGVGMNVGASEHGKASVSVWARVDVCVGVCVAWACEHVHVFVSARVCKRGCVSVCWVLEGRPLVPGCGTGAGGRQGPL